MAKFVDIYVSKDSWAPYFVEVSSKFYDYKVNIDEDFLREYRKALDVVYRFQEFVENDINERKK